MPNCGGCKLVKLNVAGNQKDFGVETVEVTLNN